MLGVLYFFYFQKSEEAKFPKNQTVSTEVVSNDGEVGKPAGRPHTPPSPRKEESVVSRSVPKRISASSSLKKPVPKKDSMTTVSWLEGTPWKLWQGVTAIKKTQERGLGTKALGEVNGFVIIENTAENEAQLFISDYPFVVADQRLNRVGVVSGVFTVILREGVSADLLLQNPDIRVRASFPEIRTYYITSAEEPFDLGHFRKQMLSEPGIESIKIEVLSRQYEKY